MKEATYNRTYTKERLDSKVFDKVLLARLLSYFKPFRFLIAIAVLFMIIARGIEAYVPIYLGSVTQKILDTIDLLDITTQVNLSWVVQNCLTIVGLLILSYSLDAINIVIKSWIGQNALLNLRMKVYTHIQHMPLRYYDKNAVGRLMTRTIHDVDQINQMFSESVVPIIGSILLFISIWIAIFIIDLRVGIAAALIMPFVFWLTNTFRKDQRKSYNIVRTIVSAMNGFVQEHLMGASTIRSFGIERQEMEQFQKINSDHCTAYKESIHNFSLFFAGIDFLQSTFLIAIFMVLVTFAPADTGFQVGKFFTFSLYGLMLFRPLSDLSERYNVLQSAMAAAERIFSVLDQDIEDPGPSDPLPLTEVKTIEFRDVWFAYYGENWVLKGISFQISQGQSVAFVGVTGVGKTTILSLLLSLYEHQKGLILINGKEINAYCRTDIRRQFSVVLQDPVLFSGTIFENLTLFEPIDRKQVEQAVEYIHLDSLTKKFPEGLDHTLPERGKNLSAGEQQLVSMARAVCHNSSVFILDEATANIDTGTEKLIQDALKKIVADKTTLVIAHRLSTIQHVDRILVLHRGKVVETGSHTELLKMGGIYEKLFRLQFS